MVPIYLFSLLWFLALTGIGSLVSSVTSPKEDNSQDSLPIFAYSAYGLGLLGVIAISLNFFLPLGGLVAGVVLGLGLLLFFTRFREIKIGFSWLDLLICLVFHLYLSMAASVTEIADYDSGLYHIQAIQWSARFAMPAGLANLIPQLGFNSTWFPTTALLEAPFIAEQGYRLINTILSLILFTGALSGIKRVLNSKINVENIYLSLMVMPLAWLAFWSGYTNSPSTTYSSAVLFIITIYFLLQGLNRQSLKAAHVGLFLALISLTIKLSSAILFLAAGIIFLLVLRTNLKSEGNRVHARNLLILSLLLFGSFGIMWCARGYQQTGYLAYPSAITKIGSPDWAIPEAEANQHVRVIKSWARVPKAPPELVLSSWEWFDPWLKNRWKSAPSQFPFFMGGIGLVLCLVGWMGGSPKKKRLHLFLPGITCVGSLLLWFWTAPDPRFAYGPLYALSLLLTSAGMIAMDVEKMNGTLRKGFLIALCLGSIVISDPKYTLSGTSWAWWPPLPEVAVKQNVIPDSQVISVPIKSDQCWGTALPCAPEIRPGLRVSKDSTGKITRFYT